MVGGVDKGFCFSYWHLSYRRKFIRTLWNIAIGLPLLVVLQVCGVLPAFFSRFGAPNPEYFGLGYIILSLVLSVVQAWYTYYRWQQEMHSAAESDPASEF
jgi:hypothetical protein